MRFHYGILPLLLVALLTADPALAQRANRKAKAVEAGEQLAQACTTCHGTRGSSTEQAVPTIGGQIDAYLITSMKAYREGLRPSTIMERIAKAYSTKDIEALAAYFAVQSFTRPPQPVNAEKVVAGQIIHDQKCKKCHLHNGRDTNDSESPLLAGQKLQYLQRNMTEILSGKRAIEIKMKSSLMEITPDEIEATLHFYASQQGEMN
jgi:sulfide dehydrogenase cytochrome subunit